MTLQTGILSALNALVRFNSEAEVEAPLNIRFAVHSVYRLLAYSAAQHAHLAEGGSGDQASQAHSSSQPQSQGQGGQGQGSSQRLGLSHAQERATDQHDAQVNVRACLCFLSPRLWRDQLPCCLTGIARPSNFSNHGGTAGH